MNVLLRRNLWLVACLLLTATGCMTAEPFRVMTFNIRYGTAKDGENRWENRREFVFETIRAYDPDILGLQEVLDFQASELREALPGYEFVGVGRRDGLAGGEFVPIMFKKRRLRLLDVRYFWLSPTPGKPGSRGWDAALPRMVTWIQLQFAESPWEMNRLNVLNTHFDHRGKKARLESARLLRRLIESRGGLPTIVMGDFNCGSGSAPHRELTDDRKNLSELEDPFVRMRPNEPDAGTFNAFRGDRSGERIDWVLYNRRIEPIEIDIDHTDYDGRYPSDHFPVTATLRMLPGRGPWRLW